MNTPTTARPTTVVAVSLWRYGRLALLKRSSLVGSDAGLWHCVSGYLEDGVDPAKQAITEVFEETGLAVADMVAFRQGRTITVGSADQIIWTVHTFAVETTRRRLVLDWEHDRYRWVRSSSLGRYRHVSWLEQVLIALQPKESTGTAQSSLDTRGL